MAKNQKTQKSKAAKEQTKVDKPVENPTEGQKEGAGATISADPDKYTQAQKESLKSKEIEPDTSKEPGTQLTFKQAEAEMDKGIVVKLPEWEGFWFKKIGEDPIYVMTKEGGIVDTPFDEYKDRNDWQVAEPNEVQAKLLDEFWQKRKQSEIDAENKKILEDNNGLKALYFSRSEGGSFVKIKGKVTVADLSKRDKLPAGATQSSEFLLENGRVFSLRENRVTNQDLSNQLSILQKQKSK